MDISRLLYKIESLNNLSAKTILPFNKRSNNLLQLIHHNFLLI